MESAENGHPSTKCHDPVVKNAFTNIPPGASITNFVMQVVRERFETVVEKGKGLHQPVDNLAEVRTNGDREKNVVAPYRLIFEPTSQARAASNPEIDFRDDLAQIPQGTVLYECFALDKTEEDQFNLAGETSMEVLLTRARKIGRISTESEFIASAYGDYRLFFKHNAYFIREELLAAAGSASS